MLLAFQMTLLCIITSMSRSINIWRGIFASIRKPEHSRELEPFVLCMLPPRWSTMQHSKFEIPPLILERFPILRRCWILRWIGIVVRSVGDLRQWTWRGYHTLHFIRVKVSRKLLFIFRMNECVERMAK